MVGDLMLSQSTNMVNEKPNIQHSISATVELVKAGIVHHFIIGCLLNDGFTKEKAETILRWAINLAKVNK